ncbi:hypothetical protein GCM10022198_09100 [Klugiella xanthotipulae]|uniref:DUF3060 family protein n=1 Tax=Klugiella xanthotipulae TaxID=244735 RepID=A0A543I634_9MICO|nr:DUF3060 domain-containing protein [Klugiella xanthotipulae]TQM66037.1 DUF3060 family protein [Klugiella xanthotipulae]
MQLSKNVTRARRMSLVVCGVTAALMLSGCASGETPTAAPTSGAGAPSSNATVAPRGTLETPDTTAESPEKSTRESPYVCDAGENLTFTEDQAVVALMGSCGTITLSGTGITVDAELADTVKIGGSENSAGFTNDVKDVVISGGSSIFSAGALTSITVTGDKNTLFIDSVKKIEVGGSDNSIMSLTTPDSVSDSGKNNTIQ